MLKNILNPLKSSFSIEKTDSSKSDLINETSEFDCFNYLYGNFVLDDFVLFGKKDFLNKDYENFVFSDLNYYNIYDILNDNLIYNLMKRIGNKNVNFLNLASGAGKIAIFVNIFYEINEMVAVENIYELYRLSKYIWAKLLNSEDYLKLIKTNNIKFINNDVFSVNFEKFNIIFIDYNNNNLNFNEILKNKIQKECKKNTLIIKVMEPIEEDKNLILKKTKVLKNNNRDNFFIYFYEVI